MPTLAPIDLSAVDPRLTPHLEPHETVLWQFSPPAETFVPRGSFLAATLTVGLGIALLSGALDGILGMTLPDQSRLVPSLALIGVGVIAVVVPRVSARTPRVYAITDRRLVVVKGGSVFRSVRPGEVFEFYARGNMVYWRPLRYEETGKPSSHERRYPGFHGVEDPEDMLQTLQDWRESFSQRAADAASAFLASAPKGPASIESTGSAAGEEAATASAPSAGAMRVKHPGTGLTVDVPAGWPVTVRLDRDGPLEVFGVTILKRIIRPGPERPFGDGGDWNLMIARGGPDAAIGMKVFDTEIPQSYDEVLNDRWAKTFKLNLLQSNPDVIVGPFRGFSLVREMPAGANLQMFGSVGAPVAVRQIWLERNGMHVQFMGMARMDQHEVQRAVDAVVETLRVT